MTFISDDRMIVSTQGLRGISLQRWNGSGQVRVIAHYKGDTIEGVYPDKKAAREMFDKIDAATRPQEKMASRHWEMRLKGLLDPIEHLSYEQLHGVKEGLKQNDGESWAVGEMLERAMVFLGKV